MIKTTDQTLRNAARYLGVKDFCGLGCPDAAGKPEASAIPTPAQISRETLALLEQASRELSEAATPMTRISAFSVVPWAAAKHRFMLEGLPPVESETLRHLLEGSPLCVAVAVTLGRGADALIRRRMLLNPALGAAISAVASACAEDCVAKAMAQAQQSHCAAGQALSPRISPGYGDLPLAFQRPLWEAMELWRMGITLTDTHMMQPEKSVTALAAVRQAGECRELLNGEKACDRCASVHCPYRED